MQIVSPQTQSSFQSLARFYVWILATSKARWRGFLLRFAPLWVPLLLIWALPMPREIAQSNASKGNGYESVGGPESTTYIRALPDGLAHALAEPDNLGAQLNAIRLTTDYQALSNVYFEASASYMVSVPVAPYFNSSFRAEWVGMPHDDSQELTVLPNTVEWFKSIRGRFTEPWIPPYLAYMQRWNERESFLMLPVLGERGSQLQWLKQHRIPSPRVRQIRADLEAGTRREPQNAFWVWKLAQWELAYSPRTFFPPPRSNFAFAPYSTALNGYPGYAPGMGAPITAYVVNSPIGPFPLPPLVANQEEVLKRTFAILQRARSCTYYEDGYWQAKSHIKRDLQALRPMSLETSRAYFKSVSEDREYGSVQFVRELHRYLWGQDHYSNIVVPYALRFPLHSLGERTSPREMLTWSAAIAHVARLREKNERFSYSGREGTVSEWLGGAWGIGVASSKSLPSPIRRSSSAAAFITRAKRLGRSDLAREAMEIQGEFVAHDTLYSRADAQQYVLSKGEYGVLNQYGADSLLPRFALYSPTLCLGIRTVFLCLCPVWMFLNVWLIRGVGVPSSRISRWGSTLFLNVGLGIPLLWWICQFATNSAFWIRTLDVVTLVGSAILVVLPALWCVCSTVKTRRSVLVSPENERWHTHFLSRDFRPWVEPLLLAVSAFITAGAALFVFCRFGIGMTPVPLSAVNIYSVDEAVGTLAVYGAVTGAIAFLILLCNWRWPVKSVRPVTHGGLRWWKECIGASICVLAWMYLGIALMAWPARNQAKQMIEERWQMGDWVWLQKNL
ncbi:hypothetical protein EON83_08845 [bacterium]|nr:MAG: hypothetical protein EON83_08845 [bacterium]